MIALLFPLIAASATYVGTHEACDRIGARLRLARHRRLTRKHGRMLERARNGGEQQ
ncbi:MAG TPA: hypothetical protein VGS97_02780 [Actinocrinis sp.]|uniref:hypothetical protein n=1 Tax=Actinocrinis sp. TaxID=1920516 RepID=UPI002DDCDE71|nr:hypothetical protein [Actinocrinis sp.]HEV2342996.1 hypothetical protein [Actinocrinis sp.]